MPHVSSILPVNRIHSLSKCLPYRSIIIAVILCFITGCHGSSVVSVTEEAENPISEVTPQENASPESIEIPEETEPAVIINTPEQIKSVSEGMLRGGILSLPYQPVITTVTLNDVLYLLRATRYREALENALLLEDNSETVKFLRAKARILGGECRSENPVSEDLQKLYQGSQSPDLKPVFRYWLVRAWIEEAVFSNAANEIEKYPTANDIEKKEYRDLVLRYARAILSQDSIEDSRKLNVWLRKVETSGNGFEAATALYYRYSLALKSGQDKEASTLARQLVLRYPATQMALWPQLYTQFSKGLSGEERYQRAQKLIKHFDYENARIELSELLDAHVLSQKTQTEAEWELARIAMTNTAQPELSEQIYRKYAAKPGPRQEEAFFGIARAKARQLDYPGALQALEVYTSKYPNGQHAKRALYLKGWYWFDLRDNERARPFLKQYAEKTNDTSVWGFYAQTFIREGRWQEAIAAFEKIKGNTNPIVRGKALYWQAYAHHALGSEEKSKSLLRAIHEEFPFTYYDILAFRRESDWYGKDFSEAMRSRFRLGQDRNDPGCTKRLPWGIGCDESRLVSLDAWKRILTLIHHDEIDRARQIYQQNESAILGRVPAPERDRFRYFATHLVEDYNRAWTEVSGSIRAFSSIYPQRDSFRQKMAYPQAFGPLVEHLSARYGVPRFFVYAIMLQESRFRPWQVSSADAIGALQMIPKTANRIADELGLMYHPQTFFNPREGFIYSVYYMKKHLDLWHGNLTFTAGSYNGGPHRIGPWMMRDYDKTMDFIVEEFSFDESRHYARKVAEHALRYVYLYSESDTEQIRMIDSLFPEVIIAEQPADGWGY